MDWALLIIAILIITGFFFYPFLSIGYKAEKHLEENEAKENVNFQSPVDPNLRRINAYFFEDNVFSFEKFCDYVLCINDFMSLSEAAEALMELDLLVKCSGDLSERFISILTYSESITEINWKNFYSIKDDIKAKQYKGTYQDMMIIYIHAVFFLKNIIKEKRDNM